MSAEIVDFTFERVRRQIDSAPLGVEFDCGICGAHVCAFAKLDPFPSCLECRAWCKMWACS